MEYYQARTFEMLRLTQAQVEALHAKEAVIRRALMPWEIQRCFGQSTLKDEYNLSDQESEQGKVVVRLFQELQIRKLLPKNAEDLSPVKVDELHEFDDKLRASAAKGPIVFTHQRAQPIRATL